MAERGFGPMALAAILLASDLPAADFYDYAEVMAVEPVMEASRDIGRSAGCQDGGPGVHAGDGSSQGVGRGVDSLFEAVRRDLDLASCMISPPGVPRIVGYRVTYRYGGTEYVNVLNEDPGPTLKVQVRLEAGQR